MNPDTDSGTDGETAPDLTVKVFDFFSGCGGASRGFQEAGMDIVFGLDWDADAERSFKRNFPSATFVAGDIRQVDEDSIRKLVDQQRPHPILFCGCAPCQPFTKQNTTRPEPDADERVPLLLEFLRLIRRCEPDIVFVENVPGIQNVCPDSEPLRGFLRGLKDAGYLEPTYESVPLKRYGVPQGRRRFLLLASRHGRLGLPDETHGPGTDNPDFATVRDWIGDLPELAAGETDPTVPDHRAARLSPLNLKRIRATPEGGGNRDWKGGGPPVGMSQGGHRLQRCLRSHVVGPARFRAHDAVHQLLQRPIRAPRAGPRDQRRGSCVPPDVPEGLPVRR